MEWSTGTVGRHAIAGIDAHPELELIGVWVSDPAKVGRDAGRLAGLDRDLGVIATDDAEALLALKPDAIVHTAMTDDRLTEAIEDLKRFLQAGIDVVSSGPVILQFPYGVVPDDMIAPIAEAAREGAASLHVNGIDPGFANDVLPLTVTSLAQSIDEVRCIEIADYSTYYQPVVMSKIFGFGRPMDGESLFAHPGVASLGWGSVVRQLAAGLGLTSTSRSSNASSASPRTAITRRSASPFRRARSRPCTSKSPGRWTASTGWCSSITRGRTPTSARTGRSPITVPAATGSSCTGSRRCRWNSLITAGTAITTSRA